jgi:parvulin-like peptidyl-prolyl isomerase
MDRHLPFVDTSSEVPLKRFASIILLLALVISACGGGVNGEPAATVDGTVITVGEVESLMSDESSVVDRPTFAQFLRAAIQIELILAAAEADYGVTIAEDEISDEADRIYAENGLEQTREEFLDQQGFSEEMLHAIASQQLAVTRVQEQLSAEPTEEQLAEARKQAEWGLAEVCLSHILVETEEEALDVLDRLGAGEDFADLATEVSTDPAVADNSGDYGCSPPARFVEPFAEAALAAELNVPTDPVETEFGFHVLLVTDRTDADPDEVPSDEELTEEMSQTLLDQALNEWFEGILLTADVVVEEEYGTWSPGPPPQVVPPA